MSASQPLYTKTLTHSGMWSGVIGRGKTLRLTALEDAEIVLVEVD